MVLVPGYEGERVIFILRFLYRTIIEFRGTCSLYIRLCFPLLYIYIYIYIYITGWSIYAIPIRGPVIAVIKTGVHVFIMLNYVVIHECSGVPGL